jgi:hypothetical protein
MWGDQGPYKDCRATDDDDDDEAKIAIFITLHLFFPRYHTFCIPVRPGLGPYLGTVNRVWDLCLLIPSLKNNFK